MQLFEPAYRPQAEFQAVVIRFDRIVRVLLGDVAGTGEQLIEHTKRISSRSGSPQRPGGFIA